MHRNKPFKFKSKAKASLSLNRAYGQPLNFWSAYGLNQKTVASTFFLSNFTAKTSKCYLFFKFTKQLLCNIQLLPFFFAISLNSYSKMRKGILVLPSGKSLKAPTFLKAEPFEKKLTKSNNNKSSCKYFKQQKQNVRGVAKNAVDHIHGGKGRGGVLRGF